MKRKISAVNQEIRKNFIELFFRHRRHITTWLGVKSVKCPLDLWMYQELIFRIKPDIIIESGTHHGGTALFLANVCDSIGNGKVITIDTIKFKTTHKVRPEHKRIIYLHGNSISIGIEEQVKKMIKEKDKVMVILDSNHHMKHVLEELRIYSKLATFASYIIVEDTILNHIVHRKFGEGPLEAVNQFLKETKNFKIDNTCEKFLLTYNIHGYLKRVK